MPVAEGEDQAACRGAGPITGMPSGVEGRAPSQGRLSRLAPRRSVPAASRAAASIWM